MHRLAWAQENGPIPDGRMILHSCDQPRCIEPSHLRLGTALDNMRDCIARGRRAATCKKHTRVRKLTHDDVRAIRLDQRSVIDIARAYGVSSGNVYAIRSGRRKALVPAA